MYLNKIKIANYERIPSASFDNLFYLRIHSSTSAGSQTFSTVQFEYQYGKFPFLNILPLGHLYFENSLSYQSQPPSDIGGGCSGQGSTKISINHSMISSI